MTDIKNSEQAKRIRDMSITVDLTTLFNLQLSMDAKLTVLLKKVAYLTSLKTSEDANKLFELALDEVNKEMMDRFEDFHEIGKSKKGQ